VDGIAPDLEHERARRGDHARQNDFAIERPGVERIIFSFGCD
jgi:hypothetical protein